MKVVYKRLLSESVSKVFLEILQNINEGCMQKAVVRVCLKSLSRNSRGHGVPPSAECARTPRLIWEKEGLGDSIGALHLDLLADSMRSACRS